MSIPTKTLPSGDEMPVVGAGTWQLEGTDLRTSLSAALDAGYAHVDTAEGYMNEGDVGDAIADHDREDLFLTSKVLPKNLNYQSVIEACEASLDRLGTDYLDLYLVHWPNPAVSVRETMDAMARLEAEGRVRNVGVSNFSPYQLSCAQHVADVPIAVNQVEFHPYFQRPELLSYCQDNDVVVQAAAPLARTEVLGDETIREIAEDYEKSPAQVVLRWALDKGVVPLPKSSSPEHVRENLDLFDWELDAADRDRLDALDRDEPVYDTPATDWTDDVWGIAR